MDNTNNDNNQFVWDPNITQTYDNSYPFVQTLDQDNYNKTAGKSFTMNAPERYLTLKLQYDGTSSRWDGSIYILSGTFKFHNDSLSPANSLSIESNETEVLIVDSSTAIIGPGFKNIDIKKNITVKEGILTFNCSLGDLISRSTNWRLSTVTEDQFSALTLKAENWTATSDTITLESNYVMFTAEVTKRISMNLVEILISKGGLSLSAPTISLVDSGIKGYFAIETDELITRSDGNPSSSRFNIPVFASEMDDTCLIKTLTGKSPLPISADGQFHGDSLNQGLFNFTVNVDGSLTRTTLRLDVPNGSASMFLWSALVGFGLFAIDNVITYNPSRFSLTFDKPGAGKCDTINVTYDH